MISLICSTGAAFTSPSHYALLNMPATRGAVGVSAVRAAIYMQMPGQGPAIVSDETYDKMFELLLATEESIPAQISANYAMVDYGFLQRLDARIAKNDPDETDRLTEVRDACNAEMANRMQAAAEALRDVLSSPTPVIMEGKIAGFARQGRIDDALLQLLEANLQQAQQAGEQGKGAVNVLTKLQERVKQELDKRLPPATALLRQLLRMDDKDARLSLLRENMSPKQASSVILLSDSGEEQKGDEDTAPTVSPRLMAEAITEMKARFGNVDEFYDTGFVKRLLTIADEAEAVALDLAGGKELTSRQQQDMAWEQGSVSVWDLGQVEEEAHQEGKLAVWEQEAQDQMARQESASRQTAIEKDFQ